MSAFRCALLTVILLLAGCRAKTGSLFVDDTGGDSATVTVSDADSDGWSVEDGDCDDADATVHPEAEEIVYNGVDDDCDGATPDDDLDGDGFVLAEDCDDTDAAINPDAEEVCDDLDNDCSGKVDDNATDVQDYYPDADGDGRGADGEVVTACSAPEGYGEGVGDCDDANPLVHDEAAELCDGLDNDCDGAIDGAEGYAHFTADSGEVSDWSDPLAAGTALTLSEDGTLTFCAGDFSATLIAEEDITLTLTGDGPSTTTLIGDGASPILTLGEGVSATLSGLTLTGGGGNQGAGIHATAENILDISDAVFSENTALDEGGAIFLVEDGVATITDTLFSGNEATSYGGAFYIEESTLSLEAVDLTGNSSLYGGAVFADEANLEVIESTVDSNLAAIHGGAFYLAGDSELTIEGSEFTDNLANAATGNGGAIYADDSQVFARDANFSGNEGAYGGAFLLYSSTLTAVDSTFSDHYALYHGGAIYAYIFSSVSLDTVRFENDSSDSYGGVIYAEFSTLDLADVTVEDAYTFYYGGAFYLTSSEMTVSGLTARDNEAGWYGGTFWLDSSTLWLNDSSFSNNEAPYYGGAIYAQYSDLYFDDSNWSENNATNGGAVYAWVSVLTMTDATFTDNHASGGNGGGLYIDEYSEATLSAVKFSGNQAAYGGGLFIRATVYTLDGLDFSQNTAEANGGGLYLFAGTGSISNSSFEDNEAIAYGGGLYLYYADLSAETVTLSDNTAEYGAGLFSDDGSAFDGTDLLFSDNSAVTGGGAVYADIYGTLDIDASTLSDNDANYLGGGVMTYAETTLTDTHITGSSASYGGGIWMDGQYGSRFTGESLSLTENSAVQGGGFYLYQGSASLTDCWITDNEADYGAGIFDYDTDYIDSDLLLTTSAILRNEALEGAGLWSRYLSSITSVSSDWGEGTEDNTDHDLYFNEVEAYSYGDAASFACDTTACTE